MNEEQRQAWQQVRDKGKKNYLMARVRSGLLIGLVITVIREAWINDASVDEFFTLRFGVYLLNALIVFPVVFYLTGLWLWNRNEKRFNQKG